MKEICGGFVPVDKEQVAARLKVLERLKRMPRNRPPHPDEIKTCEPWLQEHIQLVTPRVVVALGRIAATTLLGRWVSMSREHGELLDCTYAGVKFKLFLTYHPAAGIYSGATKLKLQADFKKLGNVLKQLKISSYR